MSVLTGSAVYPWEIPEEGASLPYARMPSGGDARVLPGAAAVIRIRLLGRFAVQRGSAEIPLRAFGGRRAQQLLRLLALRRGELVPKDVIADALWPERQPADAAGNIEVLVSRLRRALGDRSLIQTGPGGYSLAAGSRCWVDAEAFLGHVGDGRASLAERPAEALVSFRSALEIWRGEPLAEDTYAEWAQQDRRHLALALLEALEGAATAALASGNPAEATDWAEQALAREPLRETSAMLAMRALAASGDRAGALATYDSFCRRLVREAGLEPSEDAERLHERILRGEPCPARPGGAASGRHSRAPRVGVGTSAGQRDEIAARLGRLPGRWRDVLAMVTLLGRPAAPALLAEASGRPLREVADCLDGLARAGLLRPGPHGWDLRHRSSGPRLKGTLCPAGKARVHALLACALQQRGADAAEVARQLQAAGDRVGASNAYADAAARELARLSDDGAMRLAEAGLSLQPPARARAMLLETRAEARRRRGMLADASTDLQAALESAGDPDGRSRILAELAILEARAASMARGQELVELAIAEAQGRPEALGQALAAGAIVDLPAGNLPRAERRFRRAQRLLDTDGDTRGSARLLYWQAMASYFGGRLREAVTRLGDLAHLPVMLAEVLRLWSPRATLGHALALLAEPEAGLAEIDETLAWAETGRYQAVHSECLWRRSEALAFAGRAGEAAEAAEEALAIAERIRHAACTSAALRGIGIAWDTAGDLDRAESAFRRAVSAAAGNPFFTAWASARLGACLARQGRLRDAAPHVRAALASGTPLTRYEARWADAELKAARGDEACRAAAAEALRAAQDGGYLILVPRLSELAGPRSEPVTARVVRRTGRVVTKTGASPASLGLAG